MATCWSCLGDVVKAGLDAHFCGACKKIQPAPDPNDLFGYLGLPARYRVDEAARSELEARYHELSRKLHPDRFTGASARERRLSMEKTTNLNQTIRTLRDPIKRATYLLAREGRKLEETRRADPEFLMEVMETRERIAELKASGPAGRAELDGLKGEISAKDSEAMDRLDARFGDIDAGVLGPQRDGVLDEVADIVDHHKYYQGILAELG